MAKEETAHASPKRDGVIRRGDAQKPGVQVDCVYVFRVSETGAEEPGIEKSPKNGQQRAHCGLTGLQGYPVNVRENRSRYKESETGLFEMLEFFLTAPGYGIREADGEEGAITKAKLCPPGSLILVPLNDQLKDLVRYAAHPTHTIECVVIPGEKAKKPTQSGYFPRNWEIRKVSEGVVERSAIKGLAALPALPGVTDHLPALPA